MCSEHLSVDPSSCRIRDVVLEVAPNMLSCSNAKAPSQRLCTGKGARRAPLPRAYAWFSSTLMIASSSHASVVQVWNGQCHTDKFPLSDKIPILFHFSPCILDSQSSLLLSLSFLFLARPLQAQPRA